MNPETFAQIQKAVAVLPPSSGDMGIADLRTSFPAVHFTMCSEDDVSPRIPVVAEAGDYVLYLVSGASGHCLAFTPDLVAASGVVVASKSLDD